MLTVNRPRFTVLRKNNTAKRLYVSPLRKSCEVFYRLEHSDTASGVKTLKIDTLRWCSPITMNIRKLILGLTSWKAIYSAVVWLQNSSIIGAFSTPPSPVPFEINKKLYLVKRFHWWYHGWLGSAFGITQKLPSGMQVLSASVCRPTFACSPY